MKTLKSLKENYGTYTAAAKALQIHETQLKRLIKKGALCTESGVIYIPSKTKLSEAEALKLFAELAQDDINAGNIGSVSNLREKLKQRKSKLTGDNNENARP